VSTAAEDRQEAREQTAKLRGLTAAFLVLLALAVVGTLTAVIYLAVREEKRISQNEEIQEFIRDQAVVNGEYGERIFDCTDPSGECFKESQARTAEAVVGINEGTLRVIVAALSCQGDGITEQKPLARCTVERASEAAPPRE
jgi:hypothetical protein